MTVLTDQNKVDYPGDGVRVDFPFTFPVQNNTELEVYVDEVLQPSNAYTATGFGSTDNQEGGNVQFLVAPADQTAIRLLRNVPYTQLVDYQPYGPFPARSHEGALDRCVMMIQQLRDLVVNVVSSPYPGLSLPTWVDGEYFRWGGTAQDPSIVTGTPVAQTVNSATDPEAVDGGNTTDYVYSPAQLKLAVEAHQHKIENVATLPGTPDPNTIYFVDEP